MAVESDTVKTAPPVTETPEKRLDDEPEKPDFSPDAQAGVRAVEATTSVWSKAHLIAAYVFIWLIYFVISTEEVIVRIFDPFVTSSFQMHSLTAAVDIVASIVGGLSKLPLAKILDTWGRPQGLALTLFIWVIGFIMMACSNSVEAYAAAQVFSAVGAQGVSYCLTIFVADTSSLQNRALMLAFATSPYIVTTWIGGPVADSLLAGPGWRWGFGIMCIITPVVVLPLCGLFYWNQRKAEKIGLLPKSRTRLTLHAVGDYCVAVDLFGILLLAAGMALFLLPFSIYSYQPDQWRAPLIICMLVFGVLFIAAFALWERFWAPVTFIPLHLLADRTVFFAGLMFTFVFFSSAVWGNYFSSMLLVVWSLSVTQTTYIINIYRVGSCFAALIIGVFVRWSGRFKWVAVYYGLPLMMLGIGLMIQFRQASSPIGLVVMTQIFVAFAGGPIVIAGEMAMMAPSDHQHVAAIMAILNLFGSVGTALGSTVAAAIWTGTFKEALRKYLPATAPIERIYASLTIQLIYPVTHPTRVGIGLAYGDAQRYLLITSTCLIGAAIVCAALWRDINVKSIKQVRGNVV